MSGPNILWLMTDQHHAGALSCAGHPDVRTPHLDSIAAEGERFAKAYVNNPICAPSRCCFMTGRPVRDHGVSGNYVWDSITDDPPTIPSLLRAAGWDTGFIGKAHLPRRWVESGFAWRRYCDLCDASPHDPLAVDYFRDLVAAGLGDAYDLGRLPAGHPGESNRAFTSAIPYAHSVERWTGDRAIEFLRQRDRARPFLLKVSFQRPHDPYAPSPEQARRYDPASLTLPANAGDLLVNGLAGKPAFMRDYAADGHGGYPYRPQDEDDLRRQLAHYYALISCIDDEIGRIIAEIKAQDVWRDTLVVFVADHGDFAGEHGLMLKNLGIFDAVQRIPFIIRRPGGPRGTVREDLVESLDLLPTLCGATGVAAPAGLPGCDLAQGPSRRQEVVCEWDFYRSPQTKVVALRTATHRLVFYADRPDDGELYDYASDPGEERNRWRDPALVGLRAELLGRLLAHSASMPRRQDPHLDLRDWARDSGSPVRLLHAHAWPWSRIAAHVLC